MTFFPFFEKCEGVSESSLFFSFLLSLFPAVVLKEHWLFSEQLTVTGMTKVEAGGGWSIYTL